ncbi:MAG TPA: heavy metal translocating P-type ATPase [Bacillota bacterium]
MPQRRRSWFREPLTVATLLTLVLGSAAVASDAQGASGLVTRLLYLAAYFSGGWHASLSGLKALRRREIEVDLLMVLAAVGAAVLGHWQEGAILLFLFSLSNALQALALDRTRGAVAALMELRPDRAMRVAPGGETEWIPIEGLAVGDVVRIRPGDRVPVDGRVRSGRSWVDESAMTGESLPRAKEPGDEVYTGTLNREGTLDVEITRPASDTVLARIVKVVEQARSDKAAVQAEVDRFEQRYAQVVILGTLTLAVLPILAGADPQAAVYRALTVMVVASPCAVVIAAPAAFLSALSSAARSGVLIKGGRYLEQVAGIDIVAVDKTGTLTYGRPQVAAVIPAPGRRPEEILALAAAVESHSEHPLGLAIVHEAGLRGLALPQAVDAQTVSGRGIEGTVDGRRVRVGSSAFFDGDPAAEWLERYSARLREHGMTVVWVGDPHGAGLIALRDEIRPEARSMVSALRRLGVGRIIMVSGDAQAVVDAVARRVGIDEAYGDLLPEAKVARIEELAREGRVAMVGDGINDAPALARAHVGVAMGGVGSDIALESADVVLVADELDRIPYMLELGRRTRRVVFQGLGAAMAVIAALVAATLAGRVGLAGGVVGHEGSTVLVALNGLRMLFATYRGRPERSPQRARAAAVEARERLDALESHSL